MLAKTILEEKQIPYLSLDWLIMGFNDGIPEYGIHHLLMPDEIARKMWLPYFDTSTDFPETIELAKNRLLKA